MGGPTPVGNAQTSTHDTPAPDGQTKAPPAKAPPDGPGLARVKHVLNEDPGADMKVVTVIETFPAEKDAIMAYLHKRLGNAVVDQYAKTQVLRTDRIEKGVNDHNLSGDWGVDPTDKAYLANEKVAEGGASVTTIKTTTAEAIALNALRAAQKRFVPSFVLALQKQLGVADASGAFNTDTLRKLLEQPQLASVKSLKSDAQGRTAAEILLRDDGKWLEALVPADAQKVANAAETESSADTAHPEHQKTRTTFKAFDEAETAWNPATAAASRAATTDVKLADGHRADRVAKALGYDSYATYRDTWDNVTFLSGSFGKSKVHPAVNERLAVAERWLRQRHSKKTDAQIQKEIGWSGSGNGGYADSEHWVGVNDGGPGVAPGVHMHSFGLAIDIDAGNNPYVLGGSQVARYWNTNMETHLRRAAQLYGGEAFTAQQLDAWSNEMSTEELYAKVAKMNTSWQAYLEEPSKVKVGDDVKARTPTKAEQKKGPDHDAYEADKKTRQQGADAVRAPALAARFTAIGYTAEQANRAASDWLDFTEDNRENVHAIWGAQSRTGHKLTTHSQDLMIALRDVAGLMWGGTEMSSIENGDFMHFDLRNTDYGKQVLAASHAQYDATDAKLDANDPKTAATVKAQEKAADDARKAAAAAGPAH